MKPQLLEILACPLCKAELTLTIMEEKNGEVITGTLYCQKCAQEYPITDGIPNLLPPEPRVSAVGGATGP